MTQPNSHTNLLGWAHLLGPYTCPEALGNTLLHTQAKFQGICFEIKCPTQLQPTVNKCLLPGNLLMVIIVLIFLQPLHRSCGRISPPTEDLHAANQLLNFITRQLTFYEQVRWSETYSHYNAQEWKGKKKKLKDKKTKGGVSRNWQKCQNHWKYLLIRIFIFPERLTWFYIPHITLNTIIQP